MTSNGGQSRVFGAHTSFIQMVREKFDGRLKRRHELFIGFLQTFISHLPWSAAVHVTCDVLCVLWYYV